MHEPINTMSGSYFFPRLLIALAVPLTLASLGPAESHPELGTDMGSLRRKKDAEVYRASDVRTQISLTEANKAREIVKLQAYRQGRKVHIKRQE